MNWRPNNWAEIKVDLEGSFMDITTMDEIDIGIETVADAMLEALKAKGIQGEVSSTFWGNSIWRIGENSVSEFLDQHLKEKGTLVFIPDEGDD